MSYLRATRPLIGAGIFFLLVTLLAGPLPAPVEESSQPATPSFATTTENIGATTTVETSSATTEEVSTTVRLLASPTPALPKPEQNLTAAGGNLLRAVVNILCIPKSGSPFQAASGSGVIVDPRGVIITAAHVAQYFLITDYPKPGSITCTIRIGGPAHDAYTADVVYVSPSWIEANPGTLYLKTPKGTGEDDFAFLAITGSATKDPLPASFPFVPLSHTDPTTGERVAIGAYAAQYLGSEGVQHELYPSLVFNAITDRYTFHKNTVDVISIGGTPAAQEGSSGGGVADAADELIGIVTTSSVKGDISDRVLNAITPRHVRDSFATDSGIELDSYLKAHTLPALVDTFKAEAAKLRQLIIDAR